MGQERLPPAPVTGDLQSWENVLGDYPVHVVLLSLDLAETRTSTTASSDSRSWTRATLRSRSAPTRGTRSYRSERAISSARSLSKSPSSRYATLPSSQIST